MTMDPSNSWNNSLGSAVGNLNQINEAGWNYNPEDDTISMPSSHVNDILSYGPNNYPSHITNSLLKLTDSWPSIKALGSVDAFTNRYVNNNSPGSNINTPGGVPKYSNFGDNFTTPPRKNW